MAVGVAAQLENTMRLVNPVARLGSAQGPAGAW